MTTADSSADVQPGRVTERPTAEPSHAPRPLFAQRQRAVDLLHKFGIGEGYKFSYAETLNAMTLFSTTEARAASEASDASKNEIVICAAVKMGRLIIRGHRHDDCLRNLHARQLDPAMLIEQGFVTSRNRFVSREDAMRLQKTAGAKSCYSQDGELHGDILFSEDLY